MPLKVITLNRICIFFCISSLLLFWWLPFYSYRSSNYRDCYSCRSFSLLKAIAIRLLLLFGNASKSDNYYYRNSWKRDNYIGSIQKRSHEPIYKTHTKIKAKKLRATTFAIALTKLGAIEKSSILLSQYWENYQLFRILVVAIIFSPTVLWCRLFLYLCFIRVIIMYPWHTLYS